MKTTDIAHMDKFLHGKPCGPFYRHGLTLMQARVRNFILHFIMCVIT